MRVACVGAGPAGLYFAILMKLHDCEHAVTVYERNPRGVTYGWGVVLWESTLARLHDADPELARAVERRAFRWAGQVLSVSGAEPVRSHAVAFSIGRGTLLEVLAQRAEEVGVEVRFEHEVQDEAELGDVDLVVAGDGVHSRLRERHADRFGTELHLGRNQYLWLGTTKVFESFNFGFANTEAGWIQFHGYGFDEATSTVVVESSPETWRGLGLDRLSSRESLAVLERAFAQQLDGHPLIVGGESGERLPWLRFRTLTNRTWHDGRTVLVGDAAHTTHFSIGSGTSLAIDDAVALIEALGQTADLPTALETYTTRRQAELAGPKAQAELSARFFENVARYGDLPPSDLMTIVLRRHSPLVHRIPPVYYCRLHRAADDVPVMRWARSLVGRAADALLSR